ncbi:MAG: DUF362 domain-containing protein [Candidatus Odinarchaeota archaeon]
MKYTSEVSIGLRRNPVEALEVALSKLTSPLDIPKRLARVLIKPSIYDPKLVGNTSVSVVRAILGAFKNLGSATIVESDNPLRRTTDAFHHMGYAALSNSDVSLVNLSELPTSIVKMPGYFFQRHSMPSILTEPNFFINTPTVKIEPEICAIGAGIKNLLGLIPEIDKSIYHERMDDVLLDLLSVYPPQLTVVDLTSLVIGKREDKVTKKIGAIIVGLNPVAVDSFCAGLFGIDPIQIGYLRRAYDLGLGEILLDRIRVSGTNDQKQRLFDVCRF